jgi:hypothetical protein
MRCLLLLLLSSTAYGQIYSDVDFLATELQSPVLGTDWDGFDFTTRIELGYEHNSYGIRARYWRYDESFDFSPDVPFGIEFNVIDLEATKRMGDFLVSGGFRIADESLSITQTEADTTQFGVTFAAEGNSGLLGGECWGLSAVYGGRISLLQGDWDWHPGISTTLQQIGRFQNDAQQVLEGFAGLEAYYGHAFTRVALEMQNWESNAIERRGWLDTGFTSIGTTVGVRF